MAARKRTPDQRAFDREWLVERADEGLGPTAIMRRAAEDIDPKQAPFSEIEDKEARKTAVAYERARRRSVSRLTDRQISYDLRLMRARALESGDKRYRDILERTIQELARIAFADIRSVIEWDARSARVIPSSDLNEADAAIVSSVKVKTTKTERPGGETETVVETSIDTHKKTQALRDLLRHLGGYLTVTLPIDSEDASEVIDRIIERLGSSEDPDSVES